MDFIAAVKGLIGNQHILAVLVGGPILCMTPGNAILDCRGDTPHRYAPKLSDILSIQWQLITRDQFAAEIAAAQAAAQAG